MHAKEFLLVLITHTVCTCSSFPSACLHAPCKHGDLVRVHACVCMSNLSWLTIQGGSPRSIFLAQALKFLAQFRLLVCITLLAASLDLNLSLVYFLHTCVCV